MPDTSRTQSSILALLANNTSGDISPQDLRDLVVSIFPGWGNFYISSAAQTTISGAGTAVLMAGTTTGGSTRNFTHASPGRLTYTGTPTSRFFVIATVTLDVAAGSNIDLSVQLFRSGSLITGAEQRVNNTAGNPSNVVVVTDVSLATNQYIEVFVENEDDTANIDVTQANIMVFGFLGE